MQYVDISLARQARHGRRSGEEGARLKRARDRPITPAFPSKDMQANYWLSYCQYGKMQLSKLSNGWNRMPEITTKQIHIEWEGPFSYEQLKALDGNTDYGVYQVYGCHPVYGSGVLLYIGKAEQQTFSTRLDQEWWGVLNRDSGSVQVYVGRLSGMDKPNPNKQKELDNWGKLIDLAEKLLIFAHHPASNSSNLNSLPEDAKHIHIFNWGQFRDIMAEVSGMRWSSLFDVDRNSDDWEAYSL